MLMLHGFILCYVKENLFVDNPLIFIMLIVSHSLKKLSRYSKKLSVHEINNQYNQT